MRYTQRIELDRDGEFYRNVDGAGELGQRTQRVPVDCSSGSDQQKPDRQIYEPKGFGGQVPMITGWTKFTAEEYFQRAVRTKRSPCVCDASYGSEVKNKRCHEERVGNGLKVIPGTVMQMSDWYLVFDWTTIGQKKNGRVPGIQWSAPTYVTELVGYLLRRSVRKIVRDLR